jgi:hypothetical protein
METMMLDTQRIGFVKNILNESDENLLLKVILYYNHLKIGMTVEPCQMTVSELRNEVMTSLEDASNGLGVSVEVARARHPRV